MNLSLFSVKENTLFYRSFKTIRPTSLTTRLLVVIARLPRKEVIHPHLPVGIPCYDLTPVTDSLLVPPCELSESLNFRDLTGGECKEQGHIHGGVADPPLLAIPTSCSRVADYNPN